MASRLLLIGSATLLATACLQQDNKDPGVMPPVTTIGGTIGGDDGLTTGATTSGDGGGDGNADSEKLDSNVGTAGDNPGDTGSGCSKVDLLFIIDDSGSMADEQANLLQSFPGFISSMKTELADTQGYHVGVVTTDLYIFDVECGPVSLGNMVSRTGGPDSSNAVCAPYSSGGLYMTEADNLASKFACAAQVGTGGSGNEQPMEAMLTSLSSDLTGPGGCNEGFLRDDALLVVVIITDEEDDHETGAAACNGMTLSGSAGDPQSWFDGLIALKGGKEKNVVVLSLVGPDAQAGNMCPTLDKCNDAIVGAEVATRILEFTRMFTFGFIGPVCQDYGPIFDESIATIKTACDEFVPPG